jgi:hypothetical protein
VYGSNGSSHHFGIETNRFLYFKYGQNLHIAATTFSHSYSQTSLGSPKQSKASSSVIVSIVFHTGIFANFLSSSSAFQIWISGQYLQSLTITGFQVFGSSPKILSPLALSAH